MTERLPTVLVIDDHAIVRFGLETLIGNCPQLALAGSAATLDEGLALIALLQPDLVITDMGVGESKGLDTVRAVISTQKPRSTLILTVHDELLYGEQALALGAAGYVMKENAHDSILSAAHAVLAGGRWISEKLQARVHEREQQRATGEETTQARLTPRELQILEFLRSGRTTKQIAAALDCSVRTIDVHRATIKKKLGLRTAAELIAFASNKL
ncbi:MAG TPA: response regulator transcription factor [Ramlibacter sp.]|uniref:response regulator transcription factor n=1 Tax=Ramlibacter sp. TaxID=1917967 RepID=UPI002ED1191F